MQNVNPFPQKDPDSPHKFNRIYYGVICGIIGPVIGFWIFYLMQFSHKSPGSFIELFLATKVIQSKILSLSLIFNLGLFFLFLKFDFRSAALGVLYATFAYIPVILYLKFW